MAANTSRYFKETEEQRDSRKANALARYYGPDHEAIKERNRINNKIYHQVNKEKITIRKRNERYLRLYGITASEYDSIFQQQDCKCIICKVSDSVFHLDHCHNTGHIRGILCENCNRGLGMFKDNINFLKEAQIYLSTGGIYRS